MSQVVSINTSLDPDLVARCAERLRVARTHMAAGFYHWIEAGKQFAAIKEEVRGAWTMWCRENDVAVSHAAALINVANRFANISLTVSDAEPLPIDLRAMIVLASPSVPVAVADEAVERAKAGEHISKAEAEAMVAKARAEVEAQAEQTLGEQRRQILKDARAKAAEQIEELQGKIVEDADEKKALRKRLKELDEIVNGKRQPDLEDLERVIARFSGKRSLSKLLVQSLAKELGKPINYQGVTYAPVDPAETQAKEQALLRAEALKRTLGYFIEGPSVDEILNESDRYQLERLRKTVPFAVRWINDLSEGLKKHRG